MSAVSDQQSTTSNQKPLNMPNSPLTPPCVLIESHDPARNPRSFLFTKPISQIVASTSAEVVPALRRVECEVADGRHAAGFVCYDAASGLDSALRAKLGVETPLLWFGIFQERREIQAGALGSDEAFALSDWTPSLEPDAYARAIGRIREYIAAGDTYQVNFTFTQSAGFEGSVIGLFRAMCRSQRAGFCAFVDLGRHAILSASPELFFRLEGDELTVRPMKGTMRRGRWWEEDEALASSLATCPKNRAENVMIVDLMRNDLGRVAEVGTVTVPRLYEVERYDSLLQMTSTVRCRVRPGIGLAELFASLFPSGSVTGAPKVRTMQIIEELEDGPRGIYTGCIGFLSPGPDALFNVAIRTLAIDKTSRHAIFGVGSGITHDSDAMQEYEECRLKTQFLLTSRPDFELLETLLYETPSGYFILPRHLQRLKQSARYFNFRFDSSKVVEALNKKACELGDGRFRVRLLLRRDGVVTITHAPLTIPAPEPVPLVAVVRDPVDSRDPFLYHKTTCRKMYETRQKARPESYDVLLLNERGEVTESAIANVVVKLEGRFYTPPVYCGLLPGTFRAEVLEKENVEERVLRPEDLEHAEAVYLINSVRKWVRVRLLHA